MRTEPDLADRRSIRRLVERLGHAGEDVVPVAPEIPKKDRDPQKEIPKIPKRTALFRWDCMDVPVAGQR